MTDESTLTCPAAPVGFDPLPLAVDDGLLLAVPGFASSLEQKSLPRTT